MNKYPLIKFVVLFICGIILQRFTNIGFTYLLAFFLLCFAFVTLFTFYKNNYFEVIRNISFIFLIVAAGSLYYLSFNPIPVKYPFSNPKIKNALISGKINEIDLLRKNGLVFYIETDTIKSENKANVSGINLLVRIKDSKNKLNLLYNKLNVGNEIFIKGTLMRPRDERNPGEFDYEKYLSSQGISGIVSSYNTSDIKIISKKSSLITNTIFRIRKNIDGIITSLHNESTAALLRGLLLADRSMIDNQLRDEFVNAGVIHVLAVSGLHVGFIVLIAVFLFQRFNIYLRYISVVIGLLFFLIITGMPASVTRATIMALAMLAAPLTGRSYNSINSLALAAFIILLFDPGQLFSPGFQLSFAAVLSIVIVYPQLRDKIDGLKLNSRIIKYILLFCALSFAAQIGTVPFLLMYFHRLSVVTFIANFFVIPIIGLIVALGIFTLSVGAFSVTAGLIFASTNELLCYILFHIVSFLGNPDFSVINIQNFSVFDSIIFYLLIGLAFYKLNEFTNAKAMMVMLILAALNIYSWTSVDDHHLLEQNKLSVMMIDVGQGDSFLLKFPNGKTALIDAGNATKNFDNGAKIIMPLLERFNINKIDYAFISHADADHYGGFISLVQNGLISKIFKPMLDSSNYHDIVLERLFKENNIPIEYYSRKMLNIGNVRMYILNDLNWGTVSSLSTNDQSGIIKLVYGKTSILFTGDASKRIEKDCIAEYDGFLHVNILKVGHHGSKYSSSESFLDDVNPSISLISAGIANRFHHPSKEVINELTALHIKILRTDISGASILQSNGTTFRNINWKKEETGTIF